MLIQAFKFFCNCKPARPDIPLSMDDRLSNFLLNHDYPGIISIRNEVQSSLELLQEKNLADSHSSEICTLIGKLSILDILIDTLKSRDTILSAINDPFYYTFIDRLRDGEISYPASITRHTITIHEDFKKFEFLVNCGVAKSRTSGDTIYFSITEAARKLFP